MKKAKKEKAQELRIIRTIEPETVNSVTTKNNWEVIDLAVDSGVSGTVISEDMLPNIPIKQGDASRRGVQYEVANGVRKKRDFLGIHDRFICDERFRKSMIEMGRTEEVIREMDKLANEDHTHIATEEELNVYRSNWWIRSNFVGSDTMPVRHRPDFKEALSTLRRLKKAEDQAYDQNWWQSSSSSWWQ